MKPDTMELEFLLRETRLEWSRWFRIASSFELLLVPQQGGIFAVAKDISAKSGSSAGAGDRVLAVVQFAEASNLASALCRLCSPASSGGQGFLIPPFFIRYAAAPSGQHRTSVLRSLEGWLLQQSEAFPVAETGFWISDLLYPAEETSLAGLARASTSLNSTPLPHRQEPRLVKLEVT